jgi:5'-methylthioadenosine phosphorylase
MLIPDQFFDQTRARARESTFFGEGIVAHISFGHPVCGELGDVVEEACATVEVKTHRGGTYVCMEGPAFSTQAESKLYRLSGMDVIGMTNLQEAKLAREAEICYSTLALVTDYDCWHEDHDAVSVEAVIENLNKNVRNAQKIIRSAVKQLSGKARECKCGSALKNAIFTSRELWPDATAKKLEAIIGKYGDQ